MCPPLVSWISCLPGFTDLPRAAAFAAFGFFLAPLVPSGSTSLPSTGPASIFLKRQRFPSLKAGIFCSPTYLYSVSGLTPRYCDAWRMFITSRESAAINV